MIKNRIGIYFFYDEKGVLDDYVLYFLNHFKKYCNELCVVVNGFLVEESRSKLSNCVDNLLIRENKGLDAWAYKHAIEYYGYENLKKYDELILTNFTIFGPLYPLDDFIQVMEKKECDWWGPYKWPTKEPINYHHLPSFFVGYRNSLLKSNKFKQYWETLNTIESYNDSVLYHEQRQTPYYDEKGFKNEVWMDNEKYKPFWDKHFPLYCADKLIIEDKFPFIKRRNFYIINSNYDNKLVKNSICHINKNTNYDIQMILDNLARTQDIASLDNPSTKLKKWEFWARFHPLPKKRNDYKARVFKSKNNFHSKEFLKLFEE